LRALEAVTVPFRRTEESGRSEKSALHKKEVVFLYRFFGRHPAPDRTRVPIRFDYAANDQVNGEEWGINCESRRLRR
jgi:hypothetical protein